MQMDFKASGIFPHDRDTLTGRRACPVCLRVPVPEPEGTHQSEGREHLTKARTGFHGVNCGYGVQVLACPQPTRPRPWAVRHRRPSVPWPWAPSKQLGTPRWTTGPALPPADTAGPAPSEPLLRGAVRGAGMRGSSRPPRRCLHPVPGTSVSCRAPAAKTPSDRFPLISGIQAARACYFPPRACVPPPSGGGQVAPFQGPAVGQSLTTWGPHEGAFWGRGGQRGCLHPVSGGGGYTGRRAR